MMFHLFGDFFCSSGCPCLWLRGWLAARAPADYVCAPVCGVDCGGSVRSELLWPLVVTHSAQPGDSPVPPFCCFCRCRGGMGCSKAGWSYVGQQTPWCLIVLWPCCGMCVRLTLTSLLSLATAWVSPKGWLQSPVFPGPPPPQPSPQGPDRFRILTSNFVWVVVTLGPGTRSVQGVVEHPALVAVDAAGLGEVKSVALSSTLSSPSSGHTVEVFALLKDSSILLIRNTFGPSTAQAAPGPPVVKVLAKLAVSETVVAALCSCDRAVLFAVLSDMWVARALRACACVMTCEVHVCMCPCVHMCVVVRTCAQCACVCAY
jgi:hypothetical protein